MNNRVKSEPYSDELFQEALSLLDELTGELDSRDLCRGMASWGERLLAPARERIQSKRGIERYKGLELFFASGVDVADEVEAAKSKERSKKVLPNYDYTVWRIRKAAAENARAKVDPPTPPSTRSFALLNSRICPWTRFENVSAKSTSTTGTLRSRP